MPRITAETSEENRRKAAPVKARTQSKSQLNQALELQELLLRDAKSPKTPANVRAQIARSWSALQDQVRILKGKPLPGSLRPEKVKPKQVKVKTGPVEAEENSENNSPVPDPVPVQQPSPVQQPFREEEKKP